jgi:hypothetical protein
MGIDINIRRSITCPHCHGELNEDMDGLESLDPVILSTGLTHNLIPMARELGLFKLLWRDDVDGRQAGSLISTISDARDTMLANSKSLKLLDSPNGWGTYEGFLQMIEDLLATCKEHPSATIYIWR